MLKDLKRSKNLPWDILEALNKESEGFKPNIEETDVINLIEEGEKEKPVKIGVNIPKDMKDEFIALLKWLKEIVSWSYQDMPRLNTNIVVHKISVKSKSPLVRQALRRMKSETTLKIKEEVKK